MIYPVACTNSTPAARSSPTARWEGAAPRRLISCARRDSRKSTISPGESTRGPSAWTRRCRSIEGFFNRLRIVRSKKEGSLLGASFFFSLSPLHSLTRTPLHAVAGLAHFQGKLLATEAKAGERIGSVVVSPDDCRIAVGCGLEIDHMRWYLRQHLFALRDAEFDIGTTAIPLDGVASPLQCCSVDCYRGLHLHSGFVGRKSAGRQQQRRPHQQTLRRCRELHDCSFFFPECTSGSGWGGPAHDPREKTLVFPRESPTMQPLGFGKQAARPVLLRVGVFSPVPPNRVWEDPLNPAKFPVLYRARAWWLATRLSFLTTH